MSDPVAFMELETDFDKDGHHWVHDPDNCPCGENRPPHAFQERVRGWLSCATCGEEPVHENHRGYRTADRVSGGTSPPHDCVAAEAEIERLTSIVDNPTAAYMDHIQRVHDEGRSGGTSGEKPLHPDAQALIDAMDRGPRVTMDEPGTSGDTDHG